VNPTNEDSFYASGYNDFCMYACEEVYYDCAAMICEFVELVDKDSVDAVFSYNKEGRFSRVYRVGDKAMKRCKEILEI